MQWIKGLWRRWLLIWYGREIICTVEYPVFTIREDTERIISEFKAEMDRLLERLDK